MQQLCLFGMPENDGLPTMETLIQQWGGLAVCQSVQGRALVSVPPELAQTVRAMAQQNRQTKESTCFLRPDREEIGLLGRLGLCAWAGWSSRRFWNHWDAALGEGDKGQLLPLKTGYVGLRSTSGEKTAFTFALNPGLWELSALCFAQVLVNHKGGVTINLLGWTEGRAIWPQLRFIGKPGLYSVRLKDLDLRLMAELAPELALEVAA